MRTPLTTHLKLRPSVPSHFSLPQGRARTAPELVYPVEPVERAFRRCVRTVPSLKGLLNFSHFTQGLRPGLTSIPPLLHPLSRKSGANWDPGCGAGFCAIVPPRQPRTSSHTRSSGPAPKGSVHFLASATEVNDLSGWSTFFPAPERGAKAPLYPCP